MTRFGLFATMLLSSALFVGCTGDCTSADDCEADEVCYKQVCTAANAEYLRCTGDEDCNGEGSSTLFECSGGFCRLVATGGTGNPDAGPVDTGVIPDTGVTPDSGVIPDAGTSSTADAGS